MVWNLPGNESVTTLPDRKTDWREELKKRESQQAAPETQDGITPYNPEDYVFDENAFWEEYMESERERLGIEIGEDGYAIGYGPNAEVGSRTGPLSESELNSWNRLLASFTGAQGMFMRTAAENFSDEQKRQLLANWDGSWDGGAGGSGQGGGFNERQDQRRAASAAARERAYPGAAESYRSGEKMPPGARMFENMVRSMRGKTPSWADADRMQAQRRVNTREDVARISGSSSRDKKDKDKDKGDGSSYSGAKRDGRGRIRGL